MADDITFSGGSDGVRARLDDLLVMAGLLDRMGDDFGEVAAALGKVAISDDLMQAMLLCPVEVARVEASLALAEMDSGGAASAWVRTVGRACYLRTVVEAYRDVDRILATAAQGAWQVGGFAAGAAALPVAAASLTNPFADLALWKDRKELVSGLGETLYDEPWLQEAATRAGPGVIQGTAFDLAGGNPGLFSMISGGKWPAADLQSAVAGLVTVAGMTGALHDTGTFRVERANGSLGQHRVVDFGKKRFTGAVLAQQRELSNVKATIQVVSIDGGHSYVVQIPGTQVWSPRRGDNPMDTSSNLALMAGQDTALTRAVIDAMHAAGIPPHAPVMVTGHSQGGIVAASIAAEPDYRYQFNIQAVLTAGSPIGLVRIPEDVSVLSLEENEDLVPKLDGADNPDRPNWLTATRELTNSSAPDRRHDLGAAHSLVNYEQMGEVLDASSTASMSAWRDHNAVFFGSGSIQRFRIVPDVT